MDPTRRARLMIEAGLCNKVRRVPMINKSASPAGFTEIRQVSVTGTLSRTHRPDPTGNPAATIDIGACEKELMGLEDSFDNLRSRINQYRQVSRREGASATFISTDNTVERNSRRSGGVLKRLPHRRSGFQYNFDSARGVVSFNPHALTRTKARVKFLTDLVSGAVEAQKKELDESVMAGQSDHGERGEEVDGKSSPSNTLTNGVVESETIELEPKSKIVRGSEDKNEDEEEAKQRDIDRSSSGMRHEFIFSRVSSRTNTNTTTVKHIAPMTDLVSGAVEAKKNSLKELDESVTVGQTDHGERGEEVDDTSSKINTLTTTFVESQTMELEQKSKIVRGSEDKDEDEEESNQRDIDRSSSGMQHEFTFSRDSPRTDTNTTTVKLIAPSVEPRTDPSEPCKEVGKGASSTISDCDGSGEDENYKPRRSSRLRKGFPSRYATTEAGVRTVKVIPPPIVSVTPPHKVRRSSKVASGKKKVIVPAYRSPIRKSPRLNKTRYNTRSTSPKCVGYTKSATGAGRGYTYFAPTTVALSSPVRCFSRSPSTIVRKLKF